MSMRFILVILISFVGIGIVGIPHTTFAHNTFPSYTQDGYWFLDQDGVLGEDETGWGGSDTAENTNISSLSKNTPFMYRGDVSETANQDQNQSITWHLEYAEGASSCLDVGVTWVQVTTSSSDFELVSDTQALYTNTEAMLADNISTDTSGFDVNGIGKFHESDTAGTGILDNKSGEPMWSLQATSNATDSGTYMFRVTDGGTTLNSYVRCGTVTIAAPATAPTVQTDAASSITSSSVTLNGQVTNTGGEDASTCGFAWGVTADLSGGDTATTTDSTCPTGTGSFTKALSGLTPGGQYYFRAYGTNSPGTGYGSITNFRTLIGQPRALLLGTFLLLSGTLIIF